VSPATLLSPAGSAAAAPAAGGGKAVAVVPNPFTRAATEHIEPFDDRSQIIQAAASTAFGPIDIPAFGYLRHILLLVQTSVAGVGGGNTVAANEDAPWKALRDITVTDVNGVPIIGPVTGYELYLIDKWGGYNFDTDPANGPAYSAVAVGAGATGNLAFMLRIPVEIAERDGLGALPNMNSSSTYKLWYTVAPGSEIYSTPPATTYPTLRVRAFLEAWAQPPQADLRGMPNMTTPPAMGTSQFWSKTVVNVSAGDQRIRLTRVGNLIRNLLFVFRNATPARNSTNFPDPIRLEWDGKILFNMSSLVWQNKMRENTGLAPDTGLFAMMMTTDMDYKIGNEMRDQYIATTQATRLELVGSFGVAGTLTVLTNDVAPAGDVYTTDF